MLTYDYFDLNQFSTMTNHSFVMPITLKLNIFFKINKLIK